MSKKSDLSSLLVLGLVAERPRHAYEVEACVKERRFRQWTSIGFSSIYAILDRLEREGLARSTREAVGRRPVRRTYSATAEGQAHLRDGVTHLLEQPTVQRSSISVALALSMGRPLAELVAPLERLARHADDALQQLAAREREARARWWTPVLAAVFEHDRAMIEAEARWARDTARAFAAPDSAPSSCAERGS